MPQVPIDVLFLSHGFDRTGAPLALLHLLRWLRANTKITFDVLGKVPGELEPEFRAVARRVLIAPATQFWIPQPLRSYSNWFCGKVATLLLHRKVKPKSYRLIYSNTVTNGDILLRLAHLRCPVITHAHELDFWIRNRLGLESFAVTDLMTTHYIACAKAVRDNLVIQHGVSSERVSVVHEFIALPPVSSPESRIVARRALELADDDWVVFGCGTTDWRKGVDLFVQVAAETQKRNPPKPTRFVWLGGIKNSLAMNELEYDVSRAGLGDSVRFVGSVPDPLRLLPAGDVFVLSSREDPFPLAMLEAAATGLPIICFRESGGTPEFVQNDAGIAVPYLDVAAMADAVVRLACEPDLCKELGFTAERRARADHGVELAGQTITRLIQAHLLHPK